MAASVRAATTSSTGCFLKSTAARIFSPSALMAVAETTLPLAETSNCTLGLMSTVTVATAASTGTTPE